MRLSESAPVVTGAESPGRIDGTSSTLGRLSIVITNYNYEDFVATAIESALALRWPDVEIIVVDDGSTDGSREVIRRFDPRVRSIFTENGTQRVAANRGFEQSTGDWVIFLDSDDVLPPDLAERMAAHCRPGVSKVQFRMRRIDEAGVAFGQRFPRVDAPVPAADIRRWMLRTSAYPTPPGSGNAYSRWFLERFLPVSDEIGDFLDSACLALAPLLGEVADVPDVVVGYRRHGRNDSALSVEPSRFVREIDRALHRWRFATTVAGVNSDDAALYRSRELLTFRVTARRAAPDVRSELPDSFLRCLRDTLRSPFQVGPESVRHRVMLAGWCLAVLVSPRRAVTTLTRWREGSPAT